MEQVKIVIPSRKRPHTVEIAGRLFPDALWVVADEEADEYMVPASRKLIHPNDVVGIARKRQWILDHLDDERVFMVDDDVDGVWCNVGHHGRRIEGAANIRQVIENAADIAAGIGTAVFGFSQAWDVRKYNPHNPFSLSGWIGTAIGFIGRELRFDEDLLSQADIDFCLKVLLEKRIVWIDNRFSFMCRRFNNSGGSAGIRSFEAYKRQMDKIQRRWGQWLSVNKAKGTNTVSLAVRRKQDLEIY